MTGPGAALRQLRLTRDEAHYVRWQFAIAFAVLQTRVLFVVGLAAVAVGETRQWLACLIGQVGWLCAGELARRHRGEYRPELVAELRSRLDA